MSEEVPEENPKKPVSLTDRQKREMFVRWDTGRYTHQELANWYGCSRPLITKLLAKREELHLEGGEEPAELFDGLAMKNIEDFLENIALKLSRMVDKVPDTKFEYMPLMNRTAKTVLDIRKQLRELPKDLHDQSVPINFETAMQLAELIPEENRGKYMEIMRGLAQTSDLGLKGPKYKSRPTPDLPAEEEPLEEEPE